MHARLPVTQLIEESIEPYRVFEKEITVTAKPSDGPIGEAATEPIAERRPGVVYGITNLVENAIDFARSRVEIGATWNADQVAITISDDGPGFSPGILDTLGEPYVTTRGEGERKRGSGEHGGGLGLGFFIAKTLLERSGADIEIANRDGDASGAIVHVTWQRSAFERPIDHEVEPTAVTIN
jgi:two-component system sensor histidine kinase RegB